MSFLKNIFGDYSSKEVKRILPLQKQVLALEDEYAALTDEQLKAKTPEFKERLQNGETLAELNRFAQYLKAITPADMQQAFTLYLSPERMALICKGMTVE